MKKTIPGTRLGSQAAFERIVASAAPILDSFEFHAK
jgi:hypothetical protein